MARTLKIKPKTATTTAKPAAKQAAKQAAKPRAKTESPVLAAPVKAAKKVGKAAATEAALPTPTGLLMARPRTVAHTAGERPGDYRYLWNRLTAAGREALSQETGIGLSQLRNYATGPRIATPARAKLIAEAAKKLGVAKRIDLASFARAAQSAGQRMPRATAESRAA